MKKSVSVLLVVAFLALIVAPLTAAAAPLGIASPPPGCAQQYVVQYGDTLTRIAIRFGTNVWTLAAINGISNVDRIYAGRVLCVRTVTPPPPHPPTPPGWWYTVRWCDTLSSIGIRYGWSWTYLAQVNHLSNPNFIWAGQKLLIPFH